MASVKFKDLTLREGQQVPGLEITEKNGKLILESLSKLDVGCVEVAFPRAKNRNSWFRHADKLGLRTAALARANANDIDAALAVDPDEIEVIITASDLQLKHALQKSRQEALELLEDNLKYALTGAEAGVTLMDAIRADDSFLQKGAKIIKEAGGKHITLADTTGSGTPNEVYETVSSVREVVDIDIAIHTHNDLGVATANTVSAIDAGADSVDATIGGIGERVGNAPLEEVATILNQRGDTPRVNTNNLIPICEDIHEILDVSVSGNKPIISKRAYRHESGMHTAAMLQNPSTYEAFDPTDYGGRRELLFGEGTGRGSVRALFQKENIDFSEETIDEALGVIVKKASQKDRPLTLEEATETIQSI